MSTGVPTLEVLFSAQPGNPRRLRLTSALLTFQFRGALRLAYGCCGRKRVKAFVAHSVYLTWIARCFKLKGMNSDVTFGEYLRHLRRRKHWGLQELARETGLSLSHLSRLENDNGLPKPETVVKLSVALGGDLDQMLEMANCLPREIIDRLSRRAAGAGESLRRTAGQPPGDSTYPRALVEDIDPTVRDWITERFGLSGEDLDGVFQVLQRIGNMTPSERESVIRFLSPDSQA